MDAHTRLQDDRWPTYTGDSVGKWEGDTLVFDTLSTKHSQWPTNGDTVLDRTGLVLSDAAHVVTRLRDWTSRPWRRGW